MAVSAQHQDTTVRVSELLGDRPLELPFADRLADQPPAELLRLVSDHDEKRRSSIGMLSA